MEVVFIASLGFYIKRNYKLTEMGKQLGLKANCMQRIRAEFQKA